MNFYIFYIKIRGGTGNFKISTASKDGYPIDLNANFGVLGFNS